MRQRLNPSVTFSHEAIRTRLYRYGRDLNTHDLIKILGVLLMAVDHVGQYVLDDNSWCRLFGRGAAPLFFFLLGYVNKLNIHPALLVYGLLLTFAASIQFNHLWMNILLNFVVVQWLLWQWPPSCFKPPFLLVIFIVLFGLNVLISPYVEYGFLGLMIAMSARLVAQNHRSAPQFMALGLFFYFGYQSVVFSFLKDNVYLAILGVMLLSFYYVFTRYRLRPIICFYHLILLQAYFFYQVWLHSY
jgi:hypothetical protein